MTDTVKLLTLMSDAERAQWERMAENDRLASITDWIIPPQAMKDPEPFTLSVSAPSGRLDTLYIGAEPSDADVDSMAVCLMAAERDCTFREASAVFDEWIDARRVLVRRQAEAALAHMGYLPTVVQLRAEKNNLAQIALQQANRINAKDSEIIMLRAERDLWKGLHSDLVAKFSATVPTPEPKPAPEHDPFRNFSGDPRRLGR